MTQEQELILKAIIIGIALIIWGVWQWREKNKKQEDSVDLSSVINPNENHNFNEIFQKFVEKDDESDKLQLLEEKHDSKEEIEQTPMATHEIMTPNTSSDINLSAMVEQGMNKREIARVLRVSTTEVEMLLEMNKRKS